MSTLQGKRIAALEKATPTQTEPVEIIYTIIRPDLSVAGHMLHTRDGLVSLAPDDPRLKDCEPATEEVNAGYRAGERP